MTNKHCFSRMTLCMAWMLFFFVKISNAQPVQLKNAAIAVSPSVPDPMRTTVVKVLQEEISKRTAIRLNTTGSWPVKSVPVIAIVLSSDKEYTGKKVPVSSNTASAEYKKEGYRVVSENNGGQQVIWIIGADTRGVLFGAGWLLRNLEMKNKTLELKQPVNIASSPLYPIRGHQLGYRHTANSYDAWTVQQFDEYIRELAIFGSNAVEGIPFHEDDKGSPHFKIPASEMRIRISEICRAYDMDYWVWTPVEFDLKDKNRRDAELQVHEQFYKACPRLDHIFFPGGDPGDNHPSEVLPFLHELQKRLIKYHPNAKMWISLQGFNTEQIDYFYQYLENYNPDWLEGVVSGPSSPPIAETRYRLPATYKHRQYPDITHSVRCEFPVEKWDQAYALTLGRESVNPRPYAFAKIHETYAPFTDGFVSYSDGNHDDINKIIWSMRGWDVHKDVDEILREYCRFFFNDKVEYSAAAGITALEQNWNGALAANGGVEATLSYWQKLEKENPALKNNWRWQMLLLRAYYDAYTRRRLLYEQRLEEKANTILAKATKADADKAMDDALAMVNTADKIPAAPDLRQRIVELCDDLFVSTGLQTSVDKYQAKGYERGCVLDFVDYPLNNRWWLADEFAKIKALNDADEKLKYIQHICRWEHPGNGSYYDDVSSVSKGPRIKTISDDATDIAWWDNGKSRKRLSFQTFQGTPQLDYKDLDPNARYIIRVCGFGEALLRVDGIRLSPLQYNKEADTFKEWIIPLSLTQDGKITVSFDEPEESHLNWRQHSRISDIWLLKQ
ncbi:MAG: hypothetical protein KF862_00600 [Chitinophagaceae bacterium]|nr:hypothetical protein [Chitinophagaceae bacterium]